MKTLVALLLFPAVALAEPCDRLGLYAFALAGCPQFEVNPKPDTNIPLCEQPGFEAYAYLDYRCYEEVPFDYDSGCWEWDCPVPYHHVLREPVSGRIKVVLGSREEMDSHYRAARQLLGVLLGGQ